jgi:hypothetical protein
MQAAAATTAAATPTPNRPRDRYVVRPAGVLADLLGSAESGEDELLLRLRELGLISPAPAAIPAAAVAESPPDLHVVRPAGVLAELIGAAELGEDKLLLRLRELGLITYPSPLLGGLLGGLSEVLAAEVLARLGHMDLVLFGQAARACRAAVVVFGVQHAAGGESLEDED